MAEIDPKKNQRCISNRTLHAIMKAIIKDALIPDIQRAWGTSPVSDDTPFLTRQDDPGFFSAENYEKTETLLHEDLR